MPDPLEGQTGLRRQDDARAEFGSRFGELDQRELDLAIEILETNRDLGVEAERQRVALLLDSGAVRGSRNSTAAKRRLIGKT